MIWVILVFVSILMVSEALHFLGINVELTRKLVHVSAAVVVCFFPWLYSINQALVMACGLLIVFSIIEAYGLVVSVTGVDRPSMGGVAFVVGVTLAALLVEQTTWLAFQTSLLVLAFADTGAAVVGKAYQRGGLAGVKSLPGSITFFLITVGIVMISLAWWSTPIPIEKVVIGIMFSGLLTLVEYCAPWGLDNLFLPIMATMMFSLLL